MSYTNRDIVVMALMAALAGVLYTFIGQAWQALSTAFGPLGGAALGLFQFGHLIAFVVVPKRGVLFLTSVLSTAVQALIGDPAGIWVMGWGVTHGLGAELVAVLTSYARRDLIGLGLKAGVGAVFGQFFSYWLYGWDSAPWMFFVSLPIIFIASALQSGGLAAFISNRARAIGVTQK